MSNTACQTVDMPVVVGCLPRLLSLQVDMRGASVVLQELSVLSRPQGWYWAMADDHANARGL